MNLWRVITITQLHTSYTPIYALYIYMYICMWSHTRIHICLYICMTDGYMILIYIHECNVSWSFHGIQTFVHVVVWQFHGFLMGSVFPPPRTGTFHGRFMTVFFPWNFYDVIFMGSFMDERCFSWLYASFIMESMRSSVSFNWKPTLASIQLQWLGQPVGSR